MQELIFNYYDLYLQINAKKLSCCRRNHQGINIEKKNFEIIIERGGVKNNRRRKKKKKKKKKSVF